DDADVVRPGPVATFANNCRGDTPWPLLCAIQNACRCADPLRVVHVAATESPSLDVAEASTGNTVSMALARADFDGWLVTRRGRLATTHEHEKSGTTHRHVRRDGDLRRLHAFSCRA